MSKNFRKFEKGRVSKSQNNSPFGAGARKGRKGGFAAGDKFAEGRFAAEKYKNFTPQAAKPERGDAEEERDDRLKGRNAVNAALNAGRQIEKIWLNKESTFDPGLRRLLAKAKDSGVVIVETDVKALERLAGDNHQGIVAQVAVKDYIDFDLLLDNEVADLHSALRSQAVTANAGELEADELTTSEMTTPGNKHGVAELIIILDQIQDPHNLGAVLRVADALGVTAVILPKHRAACLDATVARTSAGAVEYVPCAKVTNLSNAIRKLQAAGYWVVGADMSGTDLYASETLHKLANDKLALVIGNEGSGISSTVKNACDLLVSIPMYGQVNSLNASVATAVLAYEISRLRTL